LYDLFERLLEKLGLADRIILKYILIKYVERFWTGLNWLRRRGAIGSIF
jgi:hypothetical protein